MINIVISNLCLKTIYGMDILMIPTLNLIFKKGFNQKMLNIKNCLKNSKNLGTIICLEKPELDKTMKNKFQILRNKILLMKNCLEKFRNFKLKMNKFLKN